MNNELHKTILAEKLDEVGRKNYRADFDRWISKGEPITAILSKSEYTEAALLAMEEVSKFERWTFGNYSPDDSGDNWIHFTDVFGENTHTTKDLYQIYKEEKKQGA